MERLIELLNEAKAKFIAGDGNTVTLILGSEKILFTFTPDGKLESIAKFF